MVIRAIEEDDPHRCFSEGLGDYEASQHDGFAEISSS